MRIKLFILILLFSLSNTYLFGQKKTFICIDENNNTLFSFESNYVYPFSNGLALFKTYNVVGRTKIWGAGFVDSLGNVVLPAIYDSRDISKYGFNDGVSWVKKDKDSLYILIDKVGNIISENSYEDVDIFKNGMCAVFNNGKMGFINNEGKEIIPCKYYGNTNFSDDMVLVSESDSIGGKYGFIDKSGNIVLPFIYDYYCESKFKNGECVVKIEGKIHLINKKGDIIFTPVKSNYISNFSDNLALSYIEENGQTLYGFIDRSNEWAIPPSYEYAEPFNNGYAIIKKEGKYGVVINNGEEIIPTVFDKIRGNAKIGFFSCLKDKKHFYYNCEGKPLSNENFHMIKSKKKGNYYPFKDNYNKWGYLNTKGVVHINAQYDYAQPFSEGKAWIH